MSKLRMLEKYKRELKQAKVLQKSGTVSDLINDSFELELRALSFSYEYGKKELPKKDKPNKNEPEKDWRNKLVLNNFSATLRNGRVYCILGANGAGKSTLFKLLLNLLPLHNGKINFKSKRINLDLMALNIRDRAKIISYVPQEEANSFMYKTEDIVLMSSFAQHGSAFFSPKERDEGKVQKLMEELGIGHLIGKYYPLLSGGERQLVRIARALFQECPILLMDEPTTGLDYGFQMKILTWARDLARRGYMVIFTSHNPQLASIFSDEILLLNEGAIMNSKSESASLSKDKLAKIYDYDFEIYPIVEDELVEKLAAKIKNEFDIGVSFKDSGKKPSGSDQEYAESGGFDRWLKDWFMTNCDIKYASILPNLEDLKNNRRKK